MATAPSYLPFDKIKLSNVVGIFTLYKNVNMYPVFRLIQLNDAAGIYHLGHQMHTRGTRKPDKVSKKKACKKCFRNSISIDMEPNINLKLSAASLKLTGIKSYEDGLQAFTKLKENLDRVESTLQYLSEHLLEAHECVKWIKGLIKGEQIYIISESDIIVNSSDVMVYENAHYLSLNSKLYNMLHGLPERIPSGAIKHKMLHYGENGEVIEYPLIMVETMTLIIPPVLIEIPVTLDRRLAEFFLDKMVDFTSYEEYCKTLDWMLTLKSLFSISPEKESQSLTQLGFGYGNNNYNYNLGFEVKLSLIDKIFRNNSGFTSDYHKEVAKFAKVSLPMTTPIELANQIRKKKVKWSHKFTIYKTGSVTQSGPHPVLNAIAYEKFIRIIEANYATLTK